jgi:acylphosphatase
MKHYNITVRGRVQGVFYRQSALEKAHALQIRGFVKNMPDGSVYIEAEGGENALRQFIDWCRSGPINARVTDVAITESDVKGFQQFTIER